MSRSTDTEPKNPRDAEQGAEESAPARSASPSPADKSAARLRNYSVKNMVYSLLAVFGVAFAWWVLMPNPDQLERRPVEVHLVADYAAQESDFSVWTPEGLSEEWTANFATFETYSGALSWRVGLVTPAEEYVEISQTAEPSSEWLGALTEKAGEQSGTRTVTGPDGPQEWTAYEGQERALVLETDEATTVVRGTADWAEIEEFIGLLDVA